MRPVFLVIADLSPCSQQAVAYAAALAAPLGGQLVLLNLETAPILSADSGLVVIPQEYYDQQQANVGTLQQLAAQLPVPAVVESRDGMLFAILSDAIRRWQPQVLVLGLTPEHNVLEKLLANEVLPALRDTGLPVLLVPEAAIQTPCLPRLVAIAVDEHLVQLNAAALALGPLLGSWHAAYCVVHIARPDAPADGSLHWAEAAVRRNGLLPASAACTTYSVAHEPRGGGIVQAAHDVQADMLVLPVRPRSLMGRVFGLGVAEEVVRICSVPMLLLPTVEKQEKMPAQPAEYRLAF
ncbi:universal stress protein [Hymenobacter terricola]|uniref:universal stress protein n=1 Tax=Hymenobacter terricola TaxID=2819236 RepID=UPI001B316E82|nr:universal stress protein [Hymenobacter terricola]